MKVNLESTNLSFRLVHSGFLAAVLSFGSLSMQQAIAQQPAGKTAAQPRVIAATTETPRTLGWHTPPQVMDGTATRIGHYNSEQKLRLALAVHPPHMDEEEQFIKELTIKGSPNFHQFLSADEWNARFGPSVEDEQAVVDWAKSQGLTVTNRYANRLLVDVEGTVDAIEKAFGVTINNYQVGEEVDFSNDRDPVLPSHLNGIVSEVLGLNSIQRFHRIGSTNRQKLGPDYAPGPVRADGPAMHGDGDPTKAPAYRAEMKRKAAEQAGAGPSKPAPMDSFPLDNGVADPDNIQSSEGYNYNGLQALSHCCNVHNDSGGSPAVSSIALVGYGNFQATDVEAFFGYYGMAYDINAYYINGTGYPGQDDEAPLDVEYSGAMANSYGSYLDTAHIYEYEMPNNLYVTYADAFNAIVSDDHAKVVSTSYGWEENVGFSGSQATGTMHPIFNTMVGEGWTLIASAGDNGATDGCTAATEVDYPASDSDFIAAGGTELSLDSNGLFVSEAAWTGDGSCSSNHGGGGGGVSSLFSAPYWQSSQISPYYEFNGSGEWVVTGNTMRVMPDISLTANPDIMGEWYYYNGGWHSEGGTSIVAPELAGFFAQENTYLNYIGNICGSAGTSACTPVGLANPFFYEAATGGPHLPFYDITSGCNSNSITTANPSLMYYCGLTGFDLATGWGSANMMQLAWGINWELIPAYGQPSLSFSGPATSTWYNSNQTVSWSLSDAGSSGFPAPGVAGFTQGWDTIPPDSYSKAHGGSGDSFYSGPQYPFASSGCLAFDNNGCAGGSGQGCHTVQVEGWDNQGRITYGSYGPLCYDTVVPTISSGTNPTTNGTVWVDKSVTVTVTANDPGGSNASGLYATYYAINSTSCYPGSIGACTLYTGPFTVSAAGQSYIYYFTEDNAGNYSSEPYIWVSIDETKPVTTATLSGTVSSGSIFDTAVQITLSGTTAGGSGIANTYYELDGGAKTSYSTALTVSALGSHSIKFWSVSGSGETEGTKTKNFSIASPTTATLTATPNPSKLGQSVTMTATVAATLSGTPTGTVTFYNGATNLGTGTLSGGVATLATTALPAGSLTLQVSYPATGNFLATNSAPFDQTVYGAPAAITTPAPSSTLASSSVKFIWSASSGATDYILSLGSTGAGSTNLYYSAALTTTSVTVNNLPTNGETIYARLFTKDGTTTVHNDYTFTAVTQSALTTPTPGNTLTSSSTTFSWTSVTGATGYILSLGSTGAGSTNLYYSGSTTNTSATVTGLPINGEMIYARLLTQINGTWVHTDYTYHAVTEAQAVLTTPAPSSTLAGTGVTFSWTAAPSATGYILSLGSTGAGSTNLYYSGSTTATSVNVTGLPINGETIYARLFTQLSGSWVHTDYTYTAATEAQAVLTTPAPSSTLAGASVTFTWTSAPSATGYILSLGSTGAGATNLYYSGATTNTSVTVNNLPTNGETIYARLFTQLNGTWVHTDYTYTAQ